MSTADTYPRWLLRTFADEWPGGLPGDTDPGGPLVLEDRNDSVIVDVDTSTDPTTLTDQFATEDFDLSRGNALGVALTDYTEEPTGLGNTEYQIEPILSVRIEAAPERVHGHVADDTEFQTQLVDPALEVVKKIDNGTLLSTPNADADAYVAEPQNHNPQQADWKDYYEYMFEVSINSYEQL